jgi:hypothetical protein
MPEQLPLHGCDGPVDPVLMRPAEVEDEDAIGVHPPVRRPDSRPTVPQ